MPPQINIKYQYQSSTSLPPLWRDHSHCDSPICSSICTVFSLPQHFPMQPLLLSCTFPSINDWNGLSLWRPGKKQQKIFSCRNTVQKVFYDAQDLRSYVYNNSTIFLHAGRLSPWKSLPSDQWFNLSEVDWCNPSLNFPWCKEPLISLR